jgi:UDPglucose--hexose-1-phosphate uridylyltransferase
MTISFKKINDSIRLRHPFRDFSMDEIPFEIRYDPLTGQSTRIFDLPYQPIGRPDFKELIIKSKEMDCPFCPESFEKMTPLFPEELVKRGRIHVGEAALFPNFLPLDRYAGVCIFGRDHFIDPGGFTPEIIRDGFTAARTFIEIIARHDPGVRFFNINWNYMPPSGSSIVHPHIQVNCGEIPTYQPRLQMECSHDYFLKNGRTFWEEYMNAEKESGERALTEIGSTFWTLSFAPQGALPDVWCIFSECCSLVDWKDEERDAFLKGLTATLRYFDQQGLYSFNVSIFSGRENDHYRVNARITPRLLLREIGNSDQSYYQVLHREPTSLRPPESVREEVLTVFKKAFYQS